MKIKTITKKRVNTIVYNFSVTEDESYVVEGVKVKNCRGIWVPIFKIDKSRPTIGKIPASITSRFNTVDGKPLSNSFKQLKKPIVKKSNIDAQKELKNRLK